MLFRRKKGKLLERLIQRERDNALMGVQFEEQNRRIQGMSEIITDFETSEFHVVVGEGFSLVTNKNSNKQGSNSIEISTYGLNTKDGETTFSFKLKHPRTYR